MPTQTEKDWETINDLSNPDTLCKIIPRIMGYDKVYNDIAEMQKFGGQENIGKFTKTTGWFPDKSMQRVGWIPIELYAAIEQLSPGFFSNRKNRDRFLKANPQFDVRRKV